MSEYISLYMNNPTNGGTDGTAVSENMSQTSPVSVVLNATENETKAVKAALRCSVGYKTSGNTKVSFAFWDGASYKDSGGSIEKWQVAKDNDFTEETVLNVGEWKNSLEIEDVINSKNYCFWLKIAADSTEAPHTDKTVSIHIEGTIEEDV